MKLRRKSVFVFKLMSTTPRPVQTNFCLKKIRRTLSLFPTRKKMNAPRAISSKTKVWRTFCIISPWEPPASSSRSLWPISPGSRHSPEQSTSVLREKNAQNQYHHSLKKKAASKEGRGQMFNINTTLANYLSQTCRKHVKGRICKQNVVADIVHSKKYKTVCTDDWIQNCGDKAKK